MSVLLVITAGLIAPPLSQQRQPPDAAEGDCGQTSLYELCRRLGVDVSFETVSRLCGDYRGETSFADIQRAAKSLGLSAEGYTVTPNELRITRPMGILHVDGHHFVVVTQITGGALQVANPVSTAHVVDETWSFEELGARWDSRMLVVSMPIKQFGNAKHVGNRR